MKTNHALIMLIMCAVCAQSADTVRISEGMDVKAIIDSTTTAGTVFFIDSGEYRGVSDISLSDDQEIIGEIGPNGERLAVFNGSILLDNWRQEDSVWVHDSVVPTGIAHGMWWPTFEMACKTPDNLYMDNRFLREVDTRAALDTIIFDRMVYPHIGPYEQQDINQDIPYGTWYFDMEARKVYMRDNPAGHKMEISKHVRFGGGGAPNTLVKNIIVEKYATPMQGSAATVSGAGSVIENVEVRLNHGIGLAIFSGAAGLVIRNCYVHHNAELGIKLQNSVNALVEGCEVSYNDLHRTIGAWFGEEGGIKVVSNNTNPTLRHNWVHHNWGKGLWFDGWTKNGNIIGNLCEKNAELGCFLEIMDTLNDSGVIAYNIIRRNGYCGWFYGAQAMISASKNCRIHHNVVHVDDMHDANAITVIWQIDDSYRFLSAPYGSQIRHNDITFGGNGICSDRPEAGVEGQYMKYGLALSTWGGSLDTPDKKLQAFAMQKEFLQNCGVMFDTNTFHVPAGYDSPSWHWPPLEADADGDGETDGQLMNWYSFEEFKNNSGQDVNSTLDNDMDTSGTRQLLRLRALGADEETVCRLAGFLKLDCNNLGIRGQSLGRSLRALNLNVRYFADRISFHLPAGEAYKVRVYDARGQRIIVQSYAARHKDIGGTARIDASKLGSGVYSLRIESSQGGTAVEQVTVLR